LKRVEKSCFFREEAPDGWHHNLIIGSTGKGEAEQDVGIEKISRRRHQSWSW
jgi:hypothetical protein